MRPLAMLAVLAGAATMIVGGALALMAAFADLETIDWRRRDAARWTQVAQAAQVMLTGLGFVIAGHVLQALQALLDARDAPAARHAKEPDPPPPFRPEPELTLAERIQHEFAAARARGAEITADQARARALQWLRQRQASNSRHD